MNLKTCFFALCLWIPASSGCSESNQSATTLKDAQVDTKTDAGPTQDAVPDSSEAASLADSTPADVQDAASGVPSWTSLPGDAAGCTVERLANPEEIRLFTWVPCDGVPGCERTVLTEGVLSGGPSFQAWGPGCTASDQTGTIRLGLVQDRQDAVFFADEDGNASDGYRQIPGQNCLVGGSAMWEGRYGVPFIAYPDDDHEPVRAGGVLHPMGSNNEPILFTLPTFPGSPQASWMGSERWTWWWTAPSNLISMSTSDGSDATIFAPTNYQGPVLSFGQSASAGSHFLIVEDVLPEGRAFTSRISISDGKQAPIPYLTPPSDSNYGSVAFAGSHVAWMRGISPKGIMVNDFERVEVWASPYSSNPSELKPAKIDDWPIPNMSASTHIGGHGKYAVAYATQSHPYDVRLVVWDLESKAKTVFEMPLDVLITWPMGITEHHVWAVGGPFLGGETAWVMRFKVD